MIINLNDVNYEISGDNWAGYKPAGHVYPLFQGRAVELKNGGGWAIVDETGWDGFEETDPQVIESGFAFKDEAMNRIYTLCEEQEQYA